MLHRLLLPVTDVVKLVTSAPTAQTEEKERRITMVVRKEAGKFFLEAVDNSAIVEIKVEEKEVDKRENKSTLN